MKSKHLCILLSALWILTACGEDKLANAPQHSPPTVVSVFETISEDVPLFIEFVGQTSGLKDIAIRARVEGFLEGVHFQEGSEIKKGDILYELESQPFEEKVAARMSKVAEAQTMLAKAKGDLGRIKPLAEINAVSKSDLDEAVAAHEAALAGLDAAEANLRAAKIELSYTRIHSPIGGIIGKTAAKVGDFVGRDPNPVILNTVSQIDTILVTFFITETQYLTIARYLSKSASPRQKEEEDSLELILVDGSVYEHRGRLDFVDREVNPTTGAMLVQASFPNPQKLLRPGLFAKVRTQGRIVNDGILVPQRCVMELQGLYNVFVVDAHQKVVTREVTVSQKVGSFWLITEGLAAGEQVIYEGLQKVKDGATVKPALVNLSSTNLKK